MESKFNKPARVFQLLIFFVVLGVLAVVLRPWINQDQLVAVESPFPTAIVNVDGYPAPMGRESSVTTEESAVAYLLPESTPRPRGQYTPEADITIIGSGNEVQNPTPTEEYFIDDPLVVLPEGFDAQLPIPEKTFADNPAGEIVYLSKKSDSDLAAATISSTAEGGFSEKSAGGEVPLVPNAQYYLSPDGSRVAVIGERFYLPVYRLDTTTEGISPEFPDQYLSWHPDGVHLVYRLGRGFAVFNSDTGQTFRFMPSSDFFGQVESAAFSPEGQQVAISINYSQSGYFRIVDLKTSSVLFQVDDPGIVLRMAWSPDGNQIAYKGGQGITIFDLKSGSAEPIKSECNSGKGDVFIWSPDSRYFVFNDNHGGGLVENWEKERFENTRICLVYAATGEVRSLLPETESGYLDPAWSPDGKEVAFVWAKDGRYDIYVVNIETGEIRPVTTDGAFKRFLVWRTIP